MRYIFLILSLLFGHVDAQLLVSTKTSSYVNPVSPSSLTSGHFYQPSRDMLVYQCPGYNNNSNSYPLGIFFGGYGTRGTNINLFFGSNEGLMHYLDQGDEPADILFCAPQITVGEGDYDHADFIDALAYMVANYRINLNRVYITGLSGGAFECRLIEQSEYSQIAAVLAFSGNYGSGWTQANYEGIGNWWHHGTTDVSGNVVQNGTHSFMAMANGFGTDLSVPWLVTNYWNKGHDAFVWNTNGYNRRDRTDATGTAEYDYVAWLKKFSKDQDERATLHVDYAESELTIQDYRVAKNEVDALSSGTLKTALLSRLSTLKTTLDKGGRRFIIDHGTATYASSGNVNNMTTHSSGTIITNLIDDTGSASTIDHSVVNECATSAREANLSNDRLRGTHFGFTRETNRDGMTITTSITNGKLELSDLDNAMDYDITIYHSRSNNLTDHPELTVVIGGVTKTQYSELNCTKFIYYQNVSPVSNGIEIDPDATGDTHTFITAIEILEHP